MCMPARQPKYIIKHLYNITTLMTRFLLKAYKDISCADAAKMLSVTQGELNSLAQERGWHQRSGSIVFGGQRSEEASSKGGQEAEVRVPSLELAKMAISYAREMEQIV